MAISWERFRLEQPAMFEFGQNLFNRKLAYLSTLRKDGSPRVHPITPVISDKGLFVFMEPSSPKQFDLQRDGRFQLHSDVSYMNNKNPGEFWIKGTAKLITDSRTRNLAIESASYKPAERFLLFELFLLEVGITTYDDEGNPDYKSWKAGSEKY